MTPPEKVALIGSVAFTATLVSSMSGGGSSMIMTPVWLTLGFPLPVAIASNVVNGTTWTLIAGRNYLRGHDVDWRLMGGLVVFGLLGAFLGTQVIVGGDSKIIQRIIGLIILSLVSFAFFRKDFGLESKPPTVTRFVTAFFGLPLGFYEAFFGSGNGIFTSAVLTSTRGFKMLEALGYYYVMAFAWCGFSAFIYISGGNWDLSLMVPSTLGSVVGAALGSRIGRKQGAEFVKTLFIVVGAILGLKLLLGL